MAVISLVVPVERENDVLAAHSFHFALPHDWKNPVVVAEFRMRLETSQWPQKISVVREGSWKFVLEAEELIDRLFGRDGPCVERPEDMFSAGRLAGVYLVIIQRPERDELRRAVAVVFGHGIVKDGRFCMNGQSRHEKNGQKNMEDMLFHSRRWRR